MIGRMIMKLLESREASRRQHRILALFAIIQCWQRGLDGVLISREILMRVLGLSQRVEKSRIRILKADMPSEFFQTCCPFWADKERSSLTYVLICKQKIPFDEEGVHETSEGYALDLFTKHKSPKIKELVIWPTPSVRAIASKSLAL
jgi:hypothetical protein